MTFTLDTDLGVLKLYLRVENELCKSRLSEVKARTVLTDRQTDKIERWNALPFAAGEIFLLTRCGRNRQFRHFAEAD